MEKVNVFFKGVASYTKVGFSSTDNKALWFVLLYSSVLFNATLLNLPNNGPQSCSNPIFSDNLWSGLSGAWKRTSELSRRVCIIAWINTSTWVSVKQELADGVEGKVTGVVVLKIFVILIWSLITCSYSIFMLLIDLGQCLSTYMACCVHFQFFWEGTAQMPPEVYWGRSIFMHPFALSWTNIYSQHIVAVV